MNRVGHAEFNHASLVVDSRYTKCARALMELERMILERLPLVYLSLRCDSLISCRAWISLERALRWLERALFSSLNSLESSLAPGTPFLQGPTARPIRGPSGAKTPFRNSLVENKCATRQNKQRRREVGPKGRRERIFSYRPVKISGRERRAIFWPFF